MNEGELIRSLNRTCKHCGKNFTVKHFLDKGYYCSMSCRTIVNNSKTKTTPVEDVIKRLPEYLTLDISTYKNTRSKATFFDKDYGVHFKNSLWNILNGARCKLREKGEDRKFFIELIKKQLPSYIILDESSYVKKKKAAKFFDTEYKESFSGIVSCVINGSKVCPSRTKDNRKEYLEGIRLKALHEFKKTLPEHIILFDDTFKCAAKKAKFYDKQWDEEYWGLCSQRNNDYGIGMAPKKRWAELRERSVLKEDEINIRLNNLYGDGEVKIIYSTYSNCHKVATFERKNKGVVRYIVSHVLTGLINERRYRLTNWSAEIKYRDNYQCCITGEKEKLNSHHIWGKTSFPTLETNINNGITLCLKIHREFHSKYGRNNNTKAQLLEFALSKGIDLTEKLKDCPDSA